MDKSYLEKLKENSLRYSNSSNPNDSNKPLRLPPISSSPIEEVRKSYKNIERTNLEFTTLITKRLQNLEKKCRLQEEELVSTKNELRRVKKKLENVTQERNTISEKYAEIKQQVDDMEIFLADYGLIWVGDTEEKKHQVESSPRVMDDDYCSEFISGLSKINESLFQFVAVLESLPVYIYSNGVKLSSHPFRSFDDVELIEFITDVIGGYFPSELYKMYHNGCTFEIFDRRNFAYNKNETKSNIVDFSVIENNKDYSRFNPLVFKNKKSVSSSQIDAENNKLFLRVLNSDQIALKICLKPPKPTKYLIFNKTDIMSYVFRSICYECKLFQPLNLYVTRIGKIEPSERSLEEMGITFSTVVHIRTIKRIEPTY